jgi:uncharacterized membrane protein
MFSADHIYMARIAALVIAVAIAAILFGEICFAYGIMNPFSRDYRLTGTNVAINLAKDGTTTVHETISYKFKGCYTEVFREANIQNLQDNAPYIPEISASCQPACTVHNRQYEIAGDFGGICDSDAQFFVDFIVLKGITIENDTVEFHYKIWGDNWQRPLESLSGQITLPEGANADNTIAYFNPMGIAEQHFEGSTLKFSAGKFNGYLEARLLMPKEAFGQGQNFLQAPGGLKEDAIKVQSEYAAKYYAVTYFMILLYAIIVASFIVVPYFLYKKYGKEPKTTYNAVFEREPVQGMKPYVINSLCSMKTGDTDNNAIIATLLDLVRRSHIELKETKTKALFGMKNDILLTFKNNQKDMMSQPERLVYNYFAKSAKSGQLMWSSFLSELKSRANALDYLELANKFETAVDNEYNPKKYFSSTGDTIFKVLCCLMIVLGIALFFASGIPANYPIFSFAAYLLPFMFVLPIIGLFLPRRIFGRFTEGYEIYKKSMNYKKFLTSMTLLKKYPPASIIIWEEHLVYATLFGVAEKVIREMNLMVSESAMKQSRLYPMYNMPAISSFNSAAAISSSSSSSHSSFGGSVGGGFGGGGGGAR